MKTYQARGLALALILVFVSLGCGREFDPYSRILDFRIIAVKSSLPEVRPAQTAQISVLAFSPTDDPVTYEWSWCPLRTSGSDMFACPFTDDELNALMAERLGVPELPPGLAFDFDLGTAPTAEFSYPGTAESTFQFCQAIQMAAAIGGSVPVNCDRGLEISVRLKTVSAGKEIVAGKRINLWTRSEQSNANPDVQTIQIRPLDETEAQWLLDEGADWVVDPSEDKEDWWVSLNPAAPISVWADVSFEVRSIVDPDSVEIWQPPAPSGSDEEYLPPESENIVYRWMTTGGSFDADERIFDEELNTLETASVTEFRVQRVREEDGDYDADGIPDGDDACKYVPGEVQDADGVCVVTLFSITRDGRLGLDWVQNQILVQGRRP